MYYIRATKIFQSWCLLHQLIWCDESKWWYFFFMYTQNIPNIYQRLQCKKDKCDQFRISLDIICRGIRIKSSELNFVISWLSLQMLSAWITNIRLFSSFFFFFGLKSKMTWRKYTWTFVCVYVCVCVTMKLRWNESWIKWLQLGPLNDYPI